jgi:hypothetical protein
VATKAHPHAPPASHSPSDAHAHPYASDLEAERRGWYEVLALVGRLTPGEALTPGYYVDPDWTVRDVVAHLGTWLAEAQVQLARLETGTYGGHDVDIDGLNAFFLEAMRDQPWDVARTQAQAGRSLLLQEWYALRAPDEEAAWWIRKSAAEHFDEHLPRLRAWVAELEARRGRESP